MPPDVRVHHLIIHQVASLVTSDIHGPDLKLTLMPVALSPLGRAI
jgi:hypothetical protein